MTGKTHLVCSAAVVATAVLSAGLLLPPQVTLSRTAKPLDTNQFWSAGLFLLIGIVGGLFPDLDAPESELLYAPRKLSRGASRAVVSAIGLRRSSLVGMLVQGCFALPGMLFGALIGSLSLAIRGFSHHRGLTHDLRGLLLFTGIVLLLTSSLTTIWQLAPPMVLHTTLWVGSMWTLGYLTHLLLDAATISGIPLLSERRMFHLLPRGRRIRTGTWPDTLLLRGVSLVWLVVLAGIAFIP